MSCELWATIPLNNLIPHPTNSRIAIPSPFPLKTKWYYPRRSARSCHAHYVFYLTGSLNSVPIVWLQSKKAKRKSRQAVLWLVKTPPRQDKSKRKEEGEEEREKRGRREGGRGWERKKGMVGRKGGIWGDGETEENEVPRLAQNRNIWAIQKGVENDMTRKKRNCKCDTPLYNVVVWVLYLVWYWWNWSSAERV